MSESTIEKILTKCIELDITFNSFIGDYQNGSTYLSLSCNKHNTTWESTSVYSLIYSSPVGCSVCKNNKISKANSIE